MRCNRRFTNQWCEFDLCGCSQSSNHALRRLRFVQKRYAAYCCNNVDKRVPARSCCVDTVGTTRCLQDKSSNLGPDFCHHGNDFRSPPKYLTQLLLKLVRYIDPPSYYLSILQRNTSHTRVEVMRNLSAATLPVILFLISGHPPSQRYTQRADCDWFLTSSQRVNERNKPYNLMSNKTVIYEIVRGRRKKYPVRSYNGIENVNRQLASSFAHECEPKEKRVDRKLERGKRYTVTWPLARGVSSWVRLFNTELFLVFLSALAGRQPHPSLEQERAWIAPTIVFIVAP